MKNEIPGISNQKSDVSGALSQARFASPETIKPTLGRSSAWDWLLPVALIPSWATGATYKPN